VVFVDLFVEVLFEAFVDFFVVDFGVLVGVDYLYYH